MRLWTYAIGLVRAWMFLIAFLFFAAIWQGMDKETTKPWTVGHYVIAIICMALSLMVALLLK